MFRFKSRIPLYKLTPFFLLLKFLIAYQQVYKTAYLLNGIRCFLSIAEASNPSNEILTKNICAMSNISEIGWLTDPDIVFDIIKI